jgi:hypothetical protein
MRAQTGRGSFDGSLGEWDDVADEHDWDALILGNGMSINLWKDFDYTSLYKRAAKHGLLSKQACVLFQALGVENFEQVLRALSDAMVVGRALGEPRVKEPVLHAVIRRALAEAVREVHIPARDVPAESLEAIGAALRAHRHVFTTSYDLIAYWASASGPDPRRPFDGMLDFFWADDRNAFDAAMINPAPDDTATRLHYLHGALHLVVLGDGTTCKRKATGGLKLLDQFGEPFRGDDAARPLIVTEADAKDKSRSIKGNDYLTYCWDRLAAVGGPVVVFGHSLTAQYDQHLVDALNVHPDRPVAVSLCDRGALENRKEQHRFALLLDTPQLHFFDAETHPLGAAELRLSRRATAHAL